MHEIIPKRPLHFIHYRYNNNKSTGVIKDASYNKAYDNILFKNLEKIKPVALTINTKDIYAPCLA